MRAKLSPAPDIGIRSLSIALNAYCLVAADSAGYCHVWTLKNGEELVPLQKFPAHEDYILKCLISPDVNYLATCSADKTVKIWNLAPETGYQLKKDSLWSSQMGLGLCFQLRFSTTCYMLK